MRSGFILLTMLLVLWGCHVPPITASGTMVVKSDVPVDARVHIEDTVPMRNDVRVVEAPIMHGDVRVVEAPIVHGDVRVVEAPVVQGFMQVANTTPIPVQGTVTLQGPIQLNIPGLSGGSTGTFITEELFKMVKEEVTTGEWVIAVFGEPDFRSSMSDGTEIWRWTFRPLGDQSPLFRVFGNDKEPTPETLTTCVQIRDGTVIAKWRG